MFDNFRQRIRTRQAYLNAPVTYEVLGTQADEKGVKWFTKHFGHYSIDAMCMAYTGIGGITVIVGISLLNGEYLKALEAGLISLLFFGYILFEMKRDSKKMVA